VCFVCVCVDITGVVCCSSAEMLLELLVVCVDLPGVICCLCIPYWNYLLFVYALLKLSVVV
jgi:hypothetical protein